jgi:organic radical activating enzyme
MRSLQVVTPHIDCIYNCPFCIAKTHKHDNKFINRYLDDHDYWKNNLIRVIENNHDLGYVVITGTNEPMQSIDCVRDIINIVRDTNPSIQLEIQTHYYKENDVYKDLDVVAYSIPYYGLIKWIKPCGKINRYVILLTDTYNDYSLDDLLDVIPKNVTQLTFKVLHDSNGVNKEVDEYIHKHRMDIDRLKLLKEEILKYKGNMSIRFDEFCMDSNDRYKVFREDGELYDNWEQVKVWKK